MCFITSSYNLVPTDPSLNCLVTIILIERGKVLKVEE